MSADTDYKNSLEYVRDELTRAYRIAKNRMLKLESLQIQTPTTEQANEILLKQGEVRAFNKAVNFVEARRNNHELPLSWAE